MKLEKCSSKQNTATRFSITIVFCAMSIRYVVSPVSINLITIWSSARSLELDLFFLETLFYFTNMDEQLCTLHYTPDGTL